MSRLHVDCREIPSESKCTVAISADNEEELLEASVQHAVAVHKHTDTPELRAQLRQAFKEGETSFLGQPKAGETPPYLKQELEEIDE